jgi:AcrR family transcriptional regulator
MKSPETAPTPDRILEEATRLFVKSGYNGISMREIAEAVGVSKAGLYYHFKDKEDLFLAILTANLDRIESQIQAARREGATARDQISRMMRSIMEQAPSQRAIIRLASQEMGHLSRAARARFGRLYQARFINQVEEILSAGIERGELRAVDIRTATWILLGMAYPFLYPAHESELTTTSEAIDLMVEIFFDGVAEARFALL